MRVRTCAGGRWRMLRARARSRKDSATTPSARPTPRAVRAPVLQRSGRGEGRTRSTASDIVTKSLANSSSTICSGVTSGVFVRKKPTVRKTATCTRSEEHTSELQSRGHLVCRLLLEKKNKEGEQHA